MEEELIVLYDLFEITCGGGQFREDVMGEEIGNEDGGISEVFACCDGV